MKRFFASLLSLSLLAVSCSLLQPKPTPPPPTPISDPLQTPWDDRSLFRNGLVQAEQPALEKLNGASVYHLDLTITDDLSHITGTEEVRYTNTENVPLNEIWFRLFPNILGGEMTVSGLRVDGAGVMPSYGLENSLMVVLLPRPLSPGQSVVVQMGYAVTVPRSVDQHYGVLAYYDDVLALAHAYPMICVYDETGWNAEIPPQSGDVTYADAAFYLVRVTAPKGLTLVTSGREVSRSEAGQVQALVAASGPARDFYLAASPKYEALSQTVGEVTIRSFAPREMKDGSRAALEAASRALDDFNRRFAPYPYTEFDIVATPNTALGIEYPGVIAITEGIYVTGPNNPGDHANIIMESTVAHETGHQWFYNLVGDDQLDDPWLDESLTQFATLQYFTDEYGASGAEGFRSSLENRWASLGDAKIPIGLPVAAYTPAEYSAIVYGRGPLFFVALRDQMGAQSFDAFLKEYTESLSWGVATPALLQSLAAKHCACDLQPLFDQWVYSQK